MLWEEEASEDVAPLSLFYSSDPRMSRNLTPSHVVIYAKIWTFGT